MRRTRGREGGREGGKEDEGKGREVAWRKKPRFERIGREVKGGRREDGVRMENVEERGGLQQGG